MASLVPCPSCGRHVRAHETSCPFCSAAQPEGRVPADRARPRVKRAAMVAASLAVAAVAPACTPTTPPQPEPQATATAAQTASAPASTPLNPTATATGTATAPQTPDASAPTTQVADAGPDAAQPKPPPKPTATAPSPVMVRYGLPPMLADDELVLAPRVGSRLEGALPRRGIVGLVLGDRPDGPGALVRRVASPGPAEGAGIRQGDLLLAVDEVAVASAGDARAMLARLRAGDRVRLSFEGRSAELVAAPRPLEQHEGCEVVYDHLESEGARLRAITVLPEGTTRDRSLPFVLFVQGHGAQSVDGASEPGRPLPSLAAAMAREGLAFVRLERSGSGDSEGPPLSSLDLEAERAQVAAAFAHASRAPWARPGAGVLLAHSLGDVVASHLASHLASPEAEGPSGLAVYGGGAKTWTEYFDESCRKQWRLGGVHPREQDRALRLLQRFHALLLVEGLSLGEVLARMPEAEGDPALFGLGPGGTVRGRPASYWQQVYQTSLPSLLERAGIAVLAAWGKSDWLSSREDHQLIAESAGEQGAFVEIEGADHHFAERASMESSFRANDPGALCPGVPRVLSAWARGLAG